AAPTPTSTPTPVPTPTPTPPASGGTTNCGSSPGACGYPDPNYAWTPAQNAWSTGGGGVGPVCDSTLQSYGVACTLGAPASCSDPPGPPPGGVTIGRGTHSDKKNSENGTGEAINVDASNVTLNNLCVTATGGGSNCTNASPMACRIIYITSGSNT